MIDLQRAAPTAFEHFDNDDIFECFGRSLRRRHGLMWPYAHAFLERVFPERVIRDIVRLPWSAAMLQRGSGIREQNNSQRRFFDAAAVSDFDVAFDLASAFQSRAPVVVTETPEEHEIIDVRPVPAGVAMPPWAAALKSGGDGG